MISECNRFVVDNLVNNGSLMILQWVISKEKYGKPIILKLLFDNGIKLAIQSTDCKLNGSNFTEMNDITSYYVHW